jgi:predicted alpha/beta hydrolase
LAKDKKEQPGTSIFITIAIHSNVQTSIFMKKIITLFFVLLFCISAKAQTNAAVAQSFIKAISTENYAEAVTFFDPSNTQINKEILEGGWKQIIAMFGAYQSYYIPEGVDKNAVTITVGIRFEKGTQGFACSFNDNHKLIGFILAPAPSEKAEATVALPVSRFREEEISVPVNGGTIKGTMMYPENASATVPVALIIAGSGATDRNGNDGSNLNTNAYRMLAETLAEKGIASLRYDKRLVGKSNDFVPDESKLKFEDYVQDAVNLCQYLKRDKQASAVYIIGHSEGSLIGILAAQKTPVNAFISLCGAGENIANTLKRQIPTEQAAGVIDELKSGNLTNNVPQDLRVTFRQSLQPYLISWMKYDPAVEIKKLKIPIMIVGGTTDIQVPVADAERLKKAVPQAELLVINSMNHVLKTAIADRTANIVTYNQPNLPLNADLVAGVTRFLSAK